MAKKQISNSLFGDDLDLSESYYGHYGGNYTSAAWSGTWSGGGYGYSRMDSADRASYAMLVDSWSISRGGRYRAPKGFDESLKDREDYKEAVVDMLSVTFETRACLNPSSTNKVRHMFIEQLLETSEFQALHRKTKLSTLASEQASSIFIEKYYEFLDSLPPEQQNQNGGGGDSGKGDDNDDSEGEGESENDNEEMSAADKLEMKAKVVSTVRAALKEAGEKVDEIKQIEESMPGFNPERRSNDIAKTRAIFEQIKNNHLLQDVIQKSGKYMNLAKSKQASKKNKGVDEVVGCEFSDDIGRIISSERARLSDELLELDFLRRYLERSLVCREIKEPDPECMGPVVFVVDTSGSMWGRKLNEAYAMSLAMAWIAKSQKRWACLYGYSGGSPARYLTIEPGVDKTAEVIKWMTDESGGGSNCDIPIYDLPEDWDKLGCPKGKTDVIMVTDGAAHFDSKDKKHWNEWRTQEEIVCRIIGLGYEFQSDEMQEPSRRMKDMLDICDELYPAVDITVDALGVEEAFSI